jgi:hypothetical protein
MFEILSRLDLKPGRYNLRFAMHNTALGKSGSVYSEVEVPNYEKDRLSMSGLDVGVRDGLPAAGKDTLGGIVPHAPTTQRNFARDDSVSVFARVYQGGGKPPAPVTVRTSIRDARDAVVTDATGTLAAAAQSDFTFAIPTKDLVPGAYLLAIEASTDAKTQVRRELRFIVR